MDVKFPKGIKALDICGNILKNIDTHECDDWYIMIVEDYEAFTKFYEKYSKCLFQRDGIPVSFDITTECGIYISSYDGVTESIEWICISDAIDALQNAKII